MRSNRLCLILSSAVGGIIGVWSPSANATAIATAASTYIPYDYQGTISTATAAEINLSAPGISDWAIWGNSSGSITEQQSPSASSMFTGLTGANNFTGGISPGFGYSNGTPTASLAASTSNQSYTYVPVNGTTSAPASGSIFFSVTLPAGTTNATVTVYAGQFEATPSSSSPFGSQITITGETITPVSGTLLSPAAADGSDDGNRANESVAFALSGINAASPQTFTFTDATPTAWTTVGNMGINFATVQITPEPDSLALLGIAAAGLLIRRRRHDQTVA